MAALSVRIAPEVFALAPGYRRWMVLAEALSNGPSPASLVQELRAQEAALRDQLSADRITEHPRIAAWREAYKRFGARPSDFRASIEALARRVLRGDALPAINALVDIGNLVSLRYLMPVGAHPWPEAPLSLRPAQAGDEFLPPDGSPVETPAPGEIVFAQGHAVLTRRWTWRQAAGTQTLPQTQAVFFNLDALAPVTQDDLQAAARDVSERVERYCGGRCRIATLDAAAPEFTTPP